MDKNKPESKPESKPIHPSSLAGDRRKSASEHSFPVRSMEEMLSAIRRAGGTGKLEVHFKNGQARGDAKWKGFSREGT